MNVKPHMWFPRFALCIRTTYNAHSFFFIAEDNEVRIYSVCESIFNNNNTVLIITWNALNILTMLIYVNLDTNIIS